MIPLDEIIAEARGVNKGSVGVEKEYRSAVSKFGSELEILPRASKEDLLKGLSERAAEGIRRAREGKVNIKAGFDGEYGSISIFSEDEKQEKPQQQLNLF